MDVLSAKKLAKLAGFALLVYALILLRSELLLLALSAMIAMALDPALRRLEKHIPRGLSIALLVALVGGAVAAAVYFLAPSILDQVSRITDRLPAISSRLLQHLPEDSFVRQAVSRYFEAHRLTPKEIENWMPRLMLAGQYFFGALTSLIFVYVFTIYFLIDGPRAVAWLAAFFDESTRKKIVQTCEETIPVVSAYMSGLVITSTLAATFVFTLLKLLHVPAAMTLGLIAGVFDILPIIGFVLSIVPSLTFALTVSPTTGLIVVFAYGCYHLFEAYVIAPTIYGRRMRVSGLVVLLALLIGASFGGIVGAILALPLTASYPIIERIWLKRMVGRRVIDDHQAIEEGHTEPAILTSQKPSVLDH